MALSPSKILITLLSIGALLQVNSENSSSSLPADPLNLWTLQVAKDEFNSTESPQVAPNITLIENIPVDRWTHSTALKQVLLRFNYHDCCPSFSNLTQNQEIQDELKRKFGRRHSILKSEDLINELKKVFVNVTYMSIDGQVGDSEREKYYNFYDNVQYYLRLLKVAYNYITSRFSTTDSSTVVSIQESDYFRTFERQLKGIEFKTNQDPTISSFIAELTQGSPDNSFNANFELYENFIKNTQFGQNYARNISFIRDSVLTFDQICSQLTSTNFSSNTTKPSIQYETIRQLSSELFRIKSELMKRINSRIRNNRKDVKRIFAKLDEIVETKPYIRMMGDNSSSSTPFLNSYIKRLFKY